VYLKFNKNGFIPSEYNYNILVSWLRVSVFTKSSSSQY